MNYLITAFLKGGWYGKKCGFTVIGAEEMVHTLCGCNGKDEKKSREAVEDYTTCPKQTQSGD